MEILTAPPSKSGGRGAQFMGLSAQFPAKQKGQGI